MFLLSLKAGSPFRAAPTSQETTPPPLTSLATAAAYPAALGYTTPGRATLADALQAGGTAFVNSTRKPYNIQDLASRASALALASRLNNLSLDAHVINSALKGVPGSTLKAAGAGVARTAAAMPAAPFTADPAFGQQQQQQRGAVGCNTSAGFSFSVAKAAAAAAMPDITSDTLAGAFRMAAAPAVRPAAAPAMVPILSAAPSPEGTTPASTTDQASEISPAFIPDVHTDACSSQNPAAACTPVTEGGRKLCFLDAGSASANDATPAPDAQTPDAAAATPDDFGVGTMISPQDEPGPALLQTANTRLARVLATAQKTPLPRFNELTLRDAAHYQVPVEPAPTPVAKGPAQTDYSAHFVAPSPYPLMNRPGFSLQQQPAVAAGDGGGAQAAAGVEMTQSKCKWPSSYYLSARRKRPHYDERLALATSKFTLDTNQCLPLVLAMCSQGHRGTHPRQDTCAARGGGR